MIIPGILISVVTFPGVIVHEMAHRFFCDLAGVPVYKIDYFRFGNPAGQVIHAETKGIKKAFLVAVGPLIMNTLFCMLLTFPLSFPLLVLEVENLHSVFFILAWIGFSIGMHAFPSNHDMQNFITEVKNSQHKAFLYLLALPFTFVIKIANLLRFFWFDFIYAVAISYLVPILMLG